MSDNTSTQTEQASQLPPCDPEVFSKGVSIGLFKMPKEKAESLCEALRLATGYKIDWNYFAGRAHIKALPPVKEDSELSSVKAASIEAMCRAYQAEARAEKAEADAKEWKEQIPEECPITGLPYFNSFKTSSGVYQPFYGGPCDVYGIPYKDEDGYLCRKRLCLDSMREEDENMCLEVVEEERMIDLGEAEANVARLRKERDWLASKLSDTLSTDEDGRDVLTCPSRTLRPVDHSCDNITCQQCWKEAARRAVEGK